MRADRRVPLVDRQRLSESHVLLRFRHPEIAREARAGQFVMLKAGTSAEPPVRRPFSIMDVDPDRELFSLFLKTVGPGSRSLAALNLGDLVMCLGPLGRPFDAPVAGSAALLVAGGYGIAPFVLFCRELQATGVSARVFYGGRTEADLQLREPFANLGASLRMATEDGSLGHKGLVTEVLEEHLDGHRGHAQLFACGPTPMLRAVAALGKARGFLTHVSLDPWMGCGIGTCLGCVVRIQEAGEARPRYRCACTEGPVFDAATIAWPDVGADAGTRGHAESKA